MSRAKAISGALALAFILGCLVTESFALKKSWSHSELATDQTAVKSTILNRFGQEASISKRATLDCAGASPGTQYRCINDQWAPFDTIISAGGSLPLTGAEVDLTGSLYMEHGSNLTVSGLTAWLKVEKCAVLSTAVTISLSTADVEAIRKAAKTSAGAKYMLVESSCNMATDMSVEIVSVPRECRVYKASLAQGASSTSGRFATYVVYDWDNAHCNIWWIIFICIILITAVLIVAMCLAKRLFCPKPKQNKRRVAISE